MDELRRDGSEFTEVRAHRFELIDAQGRVRAVLGDVGAPGGYAPGLELRDVDGQLRTWYALFSFGPSLNFDVGGNDVLSIGVSEEEGLTDRHPDFDPTAYISLADGTGEHRWSVSVHHEGQMEILLEEVQEELGEDTDGPGAGNRRQPGPAGLR